MTLVPGSPQYWSERARFDDAVAELQRGDGTSISLVLGFLRKRPRFHGSGYVAERMLRYLSRVPLDKKTRADVVAVVEGIANGATREGREARLLLRRIER